MFMVKKILILTSIGNAKEAGYTYVVYDVRHFAYFGSHLPYVAVLVLCEATSRTNQSLQRGLYKTDRKREIM